MSKWHNHLKQFLNAEDGPTSVEYAVMLLLILGACISGVSAFGGDVTGIFHHDGASVENAVNSTPVGSSGR